MKKHIFSCFLMLALCMSLLCACDSTAGESPTEPNEPTYSESITPVVDEPSQSPDSTATGTSDNISSSTPEGNGEVATPEQSGEQVPPLVTTSPSENTDSPKVPDQAPTDIVDVTGFSLSSVAEYNGKAYVAVNGNVPYFTDSELTTQSFELYSELDALGRCGTVYASIGQDLMPTEERGSIGMVKPTGWQTVRYDDLVDGKYLYNRCHLIGYQLTGENANTRNLITGTRYLNIEGMLPFENMVADYVKETGNHVMYRVTPIYEGNNLLASDVLMEGYSVEDLGEGICYCVYAYNVQPGVEIDYATGESKLAGGSKTDKTPESVTPTPAPITEQTPSQKEPDKSEISTQATYILNTNTKKFHYPSCSSVDDMKESNKQEFFGTRDEAVAQAYSPCGRCKP